MNCKGTPLLQRLDENSGEVIQDTNYCAVCGGTGSGEDGAYAVEIALQVKAAELAERAIQESTPNWEELAGKCLLYLHTYTFVVHMLYDSFSQLTHPPSHLPNS